MTGEEKTSDAKKITVLIVDDHPLLREGVGAVLAGEPDIVLVAEVVRIYRQQKRGPANTSPLIRGTPDRESDSGSAVAVRAANEGAIGWAISWPSPARHRFSPA
jgi:hypothetical protein